MYDCEIWEENKGTIAVGVPKCAKWMQCSFDSEGEIIKIWILAGQIWAIFKGQTQKGLITMYRRGQFILLSK